MDIKCNNLQIIITKIIKAIRTLFWYTTEKYAREDDVVVLYLPGTIQYL